MTHNKQKISGLALLLALLMNTANAQEPAKKEKARTQAVQAALNPVAGSGTPGFVSKWAGITDTSTYTLGNSNIFEDKYGRVGIGTIAPLSPLTVQGMIETTLGGYKFPDGTVQTTAFNPGQVVRSLNGLTGDVQLAAGTNITITPSGNTLTIAAPNSLSSVAHDATLTGNGTAASPLGVSDGGINTAQLANGSVTLSKIALNQVVTRINNLTESVTLAAGPNITITPSGNTLTIAGAGGSSTAYHAVSNFNGELSDPGVDVISKQVPAGSYIIFFKITLLSTDTSPQNVTCKLSTGDSSTIRLGEVDDASIGMLVLQDAATFSATATITAHCTGFRSVFGCVYGQS